ncbi:hypothetical protein G6052_06075 [Stenotrophomonas maltophilia]|nr:hypothetical protein G6052_06075 [Stenotrophomonas maltophilia]
MKEKGAKRLRETSRPDEHPDFGDNALMATFQLAVHDLLASGNFLGVDEETTTGGLIGAISATAPWCFEAHGDHPDFNWVKYKKSGNSPLAEPSTGADFALVLRITQSTCRIAIFQAKLQEENGGFSIHQISPARKDGDRIPEPQFVRLVHYARSILKAAKHKYSVTAPIEWAHYLLYKSDTIRAVPLSSLRHFSNHYFKLLSASRIDFAKKLKAAKLTLPNDISPSETKAPKDQEKRDGEGKEQKEFGVNVKEISSKAKIALAEQFWNKHKPGAVGTGNGGFNLISLLTAGASEAVSKPPGWLELETETQAKDFIKKLSTDLDFYVGRISSDPDLDPTFGGFLGNSLDNLRERGEQVSETNTSAADADLINIATLIKNHKPAPPKTPVRRQLGGKVK